MMTQPLPIAGKLPIKTLVAKQLPTTHFTCSLCTHVYSRVRHCTNRRKYVLNTYEIQRKPKGPASLRESFHDKSDQNLYVQAPNVLTSDNDEEPIVSIQMTVLAEKEKEEEPEIFINKVATESENGVSLSKDIARELGEGQETQVMKMSFDEPGEETKF